MYKKANNRNKILFIMPSFYPEQAAALSPYLIAQELNNKGYKIIVITTTPRQGRAPKHIIQYYNKCRIISYEQQHDIYIIRIKNILQGRSLLINEIINNILFMLLSIIVVFLIRIGILKLSGENVYRFKYIFNGSYLGFIHSLPAIVAKMLFKAPIVTMREDLFPFNIRDLIKVNTLFKMLLYMEKHLFKLYDIVTVHMYCLKEYIRKRLGVKNSIIISIPLGHCGAISSVYINGYNREIPNIATFIYAGTVGPFQIRTLLRFLIVARKANLKTIIVGGGEYFNLLRKIFNDFHIFYDFVPRSKLGQVIKQAKIGLACVNQNLRFPVFPSKILYYISRHMPVLFIGSKESKNCIEIKELAYIIEPNELNVNNIKDAVNKVQTYFSHDNNYMKYILKRYTCKFVANKLDHLINVYLSLYGHENNAH